MYFVSFLVQALTLALAVAQDSPSSSPLDGSSAPLDKSTSTPTSSTSIATSIAVTRVVQVFFLDERSYEGLPYTLLHRASGSVLNIDAGLTTIVVTSTLADQRPLPTTVATDSTTTRIVTLTTSSNRLSRVNNTTGQPSTITQGPATFMFTGTRYGSDHTLINRCSLNGTVSAQCNLTHVGSAWYTRNTAWNGTFSTYRYNWTSGDRFGFAPVTITVGAERLVGPDPTASGKPNGEIGRAHV